MLHLSFLVWGPRYSMDGHQPSVLVTGGSGYLGQFVVEHFGLLGYKVGMVLGKPSAMQQDHQLRKC